MRCSDPRHHAKYGTNDVKTVQPSGGYDSGTLRVSSRRRMALDLCSRGCNCALSQCLCLDRASVPEGAAPERSGADTNRAAIPYYAGRRFGDFRCA